MKGSGIYSVEVTLEVECEAEGCGNYWEEDFSTDDWGNIDQTVTCPKCSTERSFTREQEEISGPDPDVNFDE